MKKVLQYGLVLLAASAIATQCARASGLDAPRVTLFFLSGAPAARAGQGYLGVDVRDVTEGPDVGAEAEGGARR